MTNNHTNNKTLKIILWNANSLKQKESELLNFLIVNQIDLALITETHYITNSSHFSPALIFTRPTIRMVRLTLVPQI
jgi:hypothetical protein